MMLRRAPRAIPPPTDLSASLLPTDLVPIPSPDSSFDITLGDLFGDIDDDPLDLNFNNQYSNNHFDNNLGSTGNYSDSFDIPDSLNSSLSSTSSFTTHFSDVQIQAPKSFLPKLGSVPSRRKRPRTKKGKAPFNVATEDESIINPNQSDVSDTAPLICEGEDDLILGPVKIASDVEGESLVGCAFRKVEKERIKVRITSVAKDLRLTHETFILGSESCPERWQHLAIHRHVSGPGFSVFSSSSNAPEWSWWEGQLGSASAGHLGHVRLQSKFPIDTYPMLMHVHRNTLYIGGKCAHYHDKNEIIPTGNLHTFFLGANGPQQAGSKMVFNATPDGRMLALDGVTQLDVNRSTIALCGHTHTAVRFEMNKKTNKKRRVSPKINDLSNEFSIRLLSIGVHGAPRTDASSHRHIRCAHRQTIAGLMFDDEVLYSCGWDNKIKAWLVPHNYDQHVQLLFQVDCLLPTSIVCHPNDNSCISAGLDGKARLWSMPSAKEEHMVASLEAQSTFGDSDLSTPNKMAIISRGDQTIMFTAHKCKPSELDRSQFRGIKSWTIGRSSITVRT